MIYENINGVNKKATLLYGNVNGTNEELKYKYEKVNGVYRQVHRVEPLYLIKNNRVIYPYRNTDFIDYATIIDPQGYHHAQANICEVVSNGFHIGTTVHNNQNIIYLMRRVKTGDFSKLTISISQINYSSSRDLDSRIMISFIEKYEQAFTVFRTIFNEESRTPPLYYRVGTYTISLPKLNFDYYVGLRPYSTVSNQYRSSRMDCTISQLFLHN